MGTQRSMLKQHADVVMIILACMQGYDVKLHLKPDVKPRFLKLPKVGITSSYIVSVGSHKKRVVLSAFVFISKPQSIRYQTQNITNFLG